MADQLTGEGLGAETLSVTPQQHLLAHQADGVRRTSQPDALVAELGCRKTVQTGVGDVATMLAIAEVHDRRGEGSHTVIASSDEAADASDVLKHLRSTGLVDRIQLIGEDPVLVLARLLRDGHEADFALIGGGRRFEDAFPEFLYLDRMLVTGGIMSLPDHEPVGAAVLEFAARARAYEPRSVPGEQPAVLRKLGRHRATHALWPRWSSPGEDEATIPPPIVEAVPGTADGTSSEVTPATLLEPPAARALHLARARGDELRARAESLGSALCEAEQRAADLPRVRTRLVHTELELEQSRFTNRELQEQLVTSKAANCALQEQLATSQAAHAQAEHWLACLKSSASWRLTAPLRVAKSLLHQ